MKLKRLLMKSGRPLVRLKVIAVAHDFTDRKQAEQRLHAYQEQLRSLASELAWTAELERRSIAEDLHDQVGQVLSLARNKLEAPPAEPRGPQKAT
jgi:signal transduction histidine kinase